MTQPPDLSPAINALDELVSDLEGVRARAASAWAAEMHFFAKVADLVRIREREYAVRTPGHVTATQLAMREVYAEVAAALNLSEQQVALRVDQAHRLVHDFTETLYDASDGRVSAQHALAITGAGVEIQDAGTRAEYERLALEMAKELTPAQLTSALEVIVDRLDPDGTQERIRQAQAARGVRKRGLGQGMAQLVITAPTAEVEGTFNRLTDIAAEIHADNAAEARVTAAPIEDTEADERTRQQIMADVALDLLLTSAPEGHGATDERRAELGAIKATVHITIPAATLAGTAVGGASVIGSGKIDDGTARTLAGNADHWYRVFIDPTTGTPITVDKRRPCAAQKRLLRARDERCRFPGCRRPARKSDIDHTIAVSDGGPTSLWNLAHLCERHHTVKHNTDWRVEQLPGGVLRFTAPTGRIHTTRPPGAVRFIPDRPPSSPRDAPRTPASPWPAYAGATGRAPF